MEKKTLIAIVSCRSRQDTWVKAIRETWLPLVPATKADVRIFVGLGDLPISEDVVALACDDSYMGLPSKVQEICRWSNAHAYDFTLKCDDDVVLDPATILLSGYERHEYSGRANRPPQPYTVPMGFNYWLSKKCTTIMSEAPLPDVGNDDEKWVASHLWSNGIILVDEPRYSLHTKLLEPLNKRPLRALNRHRYLPMQEIEPEYFSRCIHLGEEQEIKLAEFKKVFEKYVR